jgi:hypothetical protein
MIFVDGLWDDVLRAALDDMRTSDGFVAGFLPSFTIPSS